MERAREVSRGGARARTGASGGARARDRVRARRRLPDALRRLRDDRGGDGRRRASRATTAALLAKLEESPFYPEGGGQVSDAGVVETPLAAARAWSTSTASATTRRSRCEPLEGEIGAGRGGHARSSSATRASRRCATTPPPTCCTRRCASGSARTCARRAPTSGRTSCASTSPTASACRRRSWRDVEDAGERLDRRQPRRCARSRRRRDEAERARRDGAVRREVRRLGADGRGRRRLARAVRRHARRDDRRGGALPRDDRDLERVERAPHRGGHRAGRRPSCSDERTERLREIAAMLRVPEHEVVRAVERLHEQREGGAEAPGARTDRELAERLVAGAEEIGGVRVVVEAASSAATPKALLALSDTVRQKLGDAAVVLGAAVDGRVHLVANFAPAAVERGPQGRRRGPARPRRSRAAAAAGATRWRRPAAATPRSCRRRSPPRGSRSSSALAMSRVLALDHGEARCGCRGVRPDRHARHAAAGSRAAGHPQGLGRARRLVEEPGRPSEWSSACR